MNKQLLLITLSLFLMSSYGRAQEICNNGIDDDGDGLVDCVDCADCAAAANCQLDSDNDGITDYCDLDDDNDGILDTEENPCNSVSFLNNEQVLQAAYHATLIKTTNDWLIAGQDLNGAGGNQLTFDYISNIYPYPAGATPVKVTVGGSSVVVVLFDNGDFYAAGHIGNLEIGTVFPSVVFPNSNWQKITLSLPTGVQPTDIKSMKAAGNMLMILTETGELYVTGSRVGVELNGGFSSLAFTQVPMPAGVTVQYADIAQRSLFIYGSDNNFYRYGQKTYDGDGTSVGAITVQADLMTQPNMSGAFVQMAVGNNGSYLVLDTDGKIYVLGFNIRGQLGVGNTTDVLNWTPIPGVTGAKVISVINNSGYFSAAAAGYGSGFIGADDKVYFFGGNSFNSLTNAAAGIQTTPVLASGVNADALYLELGGHITPYMSSNFGIYNTGHNSGGAFGDGTMSDRHVYSGTSIAGIVGSVPQIICSHVDSDNDGIPNDLDTDSDGDGCFDVVESGGIDINNDGILDGTGFDSNGLVAGGTGGYDGLSNTEYNAHQMTITTPPSDQIGTIGNNTSFSVVASADIATSYSNGAPIYGTGGNANSGLQYQWYLGNPNAGGTMLSDGGVYSGTSTSTLNINNVSTSLAFNEYFVVVTHSRNVCLEEIRSAVLYLAEICNDGIDNDNDGLIDCEDCADCVGASSCADNDNDGVNDICDLDDDNDGILDVEEMDCSSFTSVGTTTGNPQGISTSGFSGAAFFVGSHLFATLSNSNYTAVISKTLTGLTAGSNYDITVKGIGSTSGIHPSAIFELKIELGTTVLYDDLLTNFGNTYGNLGDISFSGNALSDDPIFKITLYKPDNLGNIDPRITSFEYTFCNPSDIDNDNIFNDLDLDSDGDGCLDVVESGGTDANNDGILDGTGFDSDGKVTGGIGGYNGVNSNEYKALRIITIPMNNQNITAGNSASFSISATGDTATSYNAGTPVYTTSGNSNTGLNYQWYIGDPNNGGTPISNGTIYSGATTSTLNISSITGLNNTTYYVQVTHDDNVCLDVLESATLTFDLCDASVSGELDTDSDGVADICDDDDDNDGILDVEEMDCSSFTSVGTTNGNPQGISTNGLSAVAFFTGSHLFSFNSDAPYTIDISKTLTGLTTGGNYDITVSGIGSSTGIAPTVVVELKIELGAVVLYDDLLTNFGNTYGNFGDISFSGKALSDNPILKITLHKPVNTGNPDLRLKSFEYIFCNPIDIDNDNISNELDLDADGDGCLDVVESGGIDNNNDGILDGTGFDSDGLVTGGTNGYNGITGNETMALQINAASMADQNITSGSSASFTIVATGDTATSYSGGSPIYGVAGNYNTGLNYQWYIGNPNNGGNLISNGSLYSGANTSTLNISDITGLNGTTFYVRVTHDDNVCLEVIDSATLTFDLCNPSVFGYTDTDNDGIADICDLDDDNDGILDTLECLTRLNETPFSVANGDSVNFSLASFGDGFVLDVTNLDNNFQLKINGVNLFTQELEFQYNAATNNIRFQDGSLFGTGGVPHVFQYGNVNPETPILRFIIDENLNVSMFGSKTTNGSLYPLELFNGAALNTFTWNTFGINEFVVTQQVLGPTSMTGRVYGIIDLCDIDGDGVDNSLDLDSDGDGCFDVVESGGLDLNNDGILDGTSIDTSGLVVSGFGGYNGTNGTEILGTQVSVITPPSDQLKNTGEATTISIIAQADAATAYSSGTPLYGTPNNDSTNLIYEWYLGNPNTTGTLIFDGGIYSGATTNTLNISSVTGLNGTQYCVVVSHANNPCIEEVRCMILSVNTTEICGDGQDNDGDGLIDCADPDCSPIIADVVPTPLSCPVGTIDGQIVITATGPGTLTYSITNEPNYQASNTFSNLGQGLYTIRVQSSTGCTDTYDAAIIQFDTPNCPEICNDGIDNDGDGAVDCDDTDCGVSPTSNIVAEDN